MKKTFLIILAMTIATFLANAQKAIELPYSKMILKLENGKWDKWPSKWSSELEVIGKSPKLVVKKINNKTYAIRYLSNFGDVPDGPFENVIYDFEKTEKLRKSNSKSTLTAYRYIGSSTYLWTSNITLDEIAENPSKWKNTKNAKIYIWGKKSAALYTSGLTMKPEQIDNNY